jgi:hypothetical protein
MPYKAFRYNSHEEVPESELTLVEDCADCPASELDIDEINDFLRDYHMHFQDAPAHIG